LSLLGARDRCESFEFYNNVAEADKIGSITYGEAFSAIVNGQVLLTLEDDVLSVELSRQRLLIHRFQEPMSKFSVNPHRSPQ
jgi:hypothetical protein